MLHQTPRYMGVTLEVPPGKLLESEVHINTVEAAVKGLPRELHGENCGDKQVLNFEKATPS